MHQHKLIAEYLHPSCLLNPTNLSNLPTQSHLISASFFAQKYTLGVDCQVKLALRHICWHASLQRISSLG